MINEVEKYYETSDLCLKISRNNQRKVAIEILEEKIRNAKNHWEIVAIKEHLATEYVLDHRIVDGRRNALGIDERTRSHGIDFLQAHSFLNGTTQF